MLRKMAVLLAVVSATAFTSVASAQNFGYGTPNYQQAQRYYAAQLQLAAIRQAQQAQNYGLRYPSGSGTGGYWTQQDASSFERQLEQLTNRALQGQHVVSGGGMNGWPSPSDTSGIGALEDWVGRGIAEAEKLAKEGAGQPRTGKLERCRVRVADWEYDENGNRRTTGHHYEWRWVRK